MSIKTKAIDLRLNKRFSLKDISKQLGVPKSTLSYWMRPYKLTTVELRERMSGAGKETGGGNRKFKGVESNLHKLTNHKLTSGDKGKIAEVAVLLRLLIMGWEVYGPIVGNNKFDWVVNINNQLKRIQVKSALQVKSGLPLAYLRCADGRNRVRKYMDNELDFIAVYDQFTDTAYIWAQNELTNRTAVSICPEAAERWDKLLGC